MSFDANHDIPGTTTVSEPLAVGVAGFVPSAGVTGGPASAVLSTALPATLQPSSADGKRGSGALAGAPVLREPTNEAGTSFESATSGAYASRAAHTVADLAPHRLPAPPEPISATDARALDALAGASELRVPARQVGAKSEVAGSVAQDAASHAVPRSAPHPHGLAADAKYHASSAKVAQLRAVPTEARRWPYGIGGHHSSARLTDGAAGRRLLATAAPASTSRVPVTWPGGTGSRGTGGSAASAFMDPRRDPRVVSDMRSYTRSRGAAWTVDPAVRWRGDADDTVRVPVEHSRRPVEHSRYAYVAPSLDAPLGGGLRDAGNWRDSRTPNAVVREREGARDRHAGIHTADAEVPGAPAAAMQVHSVASQSTDWTSNAQAVVDEHNGRDADARRQAVEAEVLRLETDFVMRTAEERAAAAAGFLPPRPAWNNPHGEERGRLHVARVAWRKLQAAEAVADLMQRAVTCVKAGDRLRERQVREDISTLQSEQDVFISGADHAMLQRVLTLLEDRAKAAREAARERAGTTAPAAPYTPPSAAVHTAPRVASVPGTADTPLSAALSPVESRVTTAPADPASQFLQMAQAMTQTMTQTMAQAVAQAMTAAMEAQRETRTGGAKRINAAKLQRAREEMPGGVAGCSWDRCRVALDHGVATHRPPAELLLRAGFSTAQLREALLWIRRTLERVGVLVPLASFGADGSLASDAALQRHGYPTEASCDDDYLASARQWDAGRGLVARKGPPELMPVAADVVHEGHHIDERRRQMSVALECLHTYSVFVTAKEEQDDEFQRKAVSMLPAETAHAFRKMLDAEMLTRMGMRAVGAPAGDVPEGMTRTFSGILVLHRSVVMQVFRKYLVGEPLL